jgi:hypothetical protein
LSEELQAGSYPASTNGEKMPVKSLDLTVQERARLEPDHHLVIDRNDELFVGLDRAESERYVTLVIRRRGADANEAARLQNRHNRAIFFWRIALAAEGFPTSPMTRDCAFNLGLEAWKAFAGGGQIADFEAMIVQVPKEQHLAALNGWLAAFDDEAVKVHRS